ncbi:MAG: macro domain-containing protein [Parachlamydia sp.]|jgi:O-acetyl-ADP-ribose deacetylase (regulator of RNase III)|nr:macro domain-containing protein [Parachlamydia sp.]
MTINNLYHSYFNGAHELSNFQENHFTTNVLALAKVISFLTIVIPISICLIYNLATLYGRLCKKEEMTEEQVRVQEVALPVIQGEEAGITEINEVRNYPGDLTIEEKETIAKLFANPQESHLGFSFHENRCAVSIRRQNLFESGADVIVNAANLSLRGGSGIDGAIHNEGGQLYADQHGLLKDHYQGHFVSGYAAMIGSGNLKNKNIDHVIVVAGPQGPETSVEKENALYSCYYNSLKLASDNNKTAIAFPSISTGIFRFPRERAAEISMKAIYDFLHDFPNTSLDAISIHFLPNERYSVVYAGVL